MDARSSNVISFLFGSDASPIAIDDHSLGRCGFIELYDDVDLEGMISGISNTTRGKKEKLRENIPSTSSVAEMSYSRHVCLTIIPSFMIPREILTFFKAYIHEIHSIQILRHYVDPEKYLALIKMSSIESAKVLIRDYNGRILTSLEINPVPCYLHTVKRVHLEKDYKHEDHRSISKSLPSSPLTLPEDFVVSGESSEVLPRVQSHIIESERERSRTLSSSGSIFSAVNTVKSDKEPKDDIICAVCLESFVISHPTSLTTYCNHVFHIYCVLKLEGPQCPVCRFQHDSSSNYMSECSDCQLQGEQLESSLTNDGNDNLCNDLWMCLVCGFIGCGSSRHFHIREHYQQHLHSYAMNVDSRRVWDFSGDGYVHRLVLQESGGDDGVTDAIIGNNMHEDDNMRIRNSNLKLSEVTTPGYQSTFRSQCAPVTCEEEELLVNTKLESIAGHYNQLVTFQLEQSRIQHEGRLQNLREFIRHEISLFPIKSGSSGGTWSSTVHQILNNERNKVLQQKEIGEGKVKILQQECDVLLELNSSLRENQMEWRKRVDMAQDKLSKTEQRFTEWIQKLEEKVSSLMSNLDCDKYQQTAGSSSSAFS